MREKSQYNPQIHRRHSNRLKGYDYTKAGAYFITICTQNRECLFGEIVGAIPCDCPDMVLNDAGEMIQTVWNEIPVYYHGVEIDEFVVMPNHIHGIVVIVGTGPCVGPSHGCLQKPVQSQGKHPLRGQSQGIAPTLSLPGVVHRFKTMTTKRYTDGVKNDGWKSFQGKLWQRNYWEHIIRNETELIRIRDYILNNPAQWESDKLYGQPPNSVNRVRDSSAEYGLDVWMV